tara:strand:- start:36033 stop:37775 length:1743 start_codon:yes stop_codon:yes gene_type:complete
MKSEGSFHVAYNARSLSVFDVCKTFVPNDSYYKLGAPSHSLLIGPRGSGKTTLMRMLQVEAVGEWTSDEACELRKKLDYTGVFIPTDRLWKQQYECISNLVVDETRQRALGLANALFLYHVLECLGDALRYRFSSKEAFKTLVLDDVNESTLIKELADLWRLKPRILSVRGLISALAKKKYDLNYELNAVVSGEGIVGTEPFLHQDVVSIIGASVKLINLTTECVGDKWVFLFDELELAPDYIIAPLYETMRGGYDDVFYKLSLSPYNENLNVGSGPTRPMPQHDYDLIRIPDLNANSFEFSKKLISHVFLSNGFEKPVEQYFERVPELNVVKVFSSLSEKDEGFRKYLIDNDIKIEKLLDYGDRDKAPTLRKVKFVAQVRDYFRSDNRRRSRKSIAPFYLGLDGLCKAMEYNPRLIIALANSLLRVIRHKSVIALSDQGEALQRIYESQSALFGSISLSGCSVGDTVYDFVNHIGEYFSAQLVGDKFVPEPNLSFLMDAHDFTEAVGAALNVGALVQLPVDEKHDFGVDGLDGIRCRLSFLMSHRYRLLMTKSGMGKLSGIVRPSGAQNAYVGQQMDLL